MKKRNIVALALLILLTFGVGLIVLTDQFAWRDDIPSISFRRSESMPSSEFLNAQRAVEYYRLEIRRNPGQVKNYVALAQLFLQEARVTANELEYLPKAERLLNQALRLDAENFEALVTKASLLLTLHQFEEARDLDVRAIAKNQYSAFAYGVLCDAYTELGMYDEAVRAVDQMLSLRPDLRSYSRASYLRELHGDLAGASEAMKLAADCGMRGQEQRAWVLYNLGKLLLDQGKLESAAYVFGGVLDERPNYTFALEGLGLVAAQRGELEKAVAHFEKAYALIPSHQFAERLATIYKRLGRLKDVERMIQIVLNDFAADEKLGANTNLEYATFCAEQDLNLEEAFQRIQKEYQRRPGNIKVLATFAWILHKKGESGRAISLMDEALRLRSKIVEWYYRAGLIAQSGGNLERAAAFLAQSLDSSLSLAPWDRIVAQQVLAALDSKGRAG